MDTEDILYIIGGIIGLIVAFAIAKEFQGIAEDKGYEYSNKYFWWTFLLAPYGIAMVIALPDRKTQSKEYSTPSNSYSQNTGNSNSILSQSSSEKKVTKVGDKWRCPDCGESNPNSIRVCRGCGREK